MAFTSDAASTSDAVFIADQLIDPTSDMAALMTLHSDDRVKCKKCNTMSRVYKTSRAWEYHYYHYHKPNHPFKCDESKCEFKYRYKRDMVKHANEKHNQILKYCDICDDIFDDNTFTSHAREHHSTSLPTSSEDTPFIDFYYDLDCDNIMRRSAEEEQQKIDRSDIKYKCDKCVEPEYKSFTTIDDLLSHHRKNHVKPAHRCFVCDHESKSAAGTRSHMRIKHYKAQFRCHHCSTNFHRQTDFERHSAKHHNVFFYCPKCTASYFHSKSLKQHIKTNHGS